MTTTETGPYPETGNDRAAALARAACEAFWAAAGAGPEGQEPTAAWDWASSQNTTRAWMAAAKAAIDANLAAADPGDFPCCTGCGPGCACGGSQHEGGSNV